MAIDSGTFRQVLGTFATGVTVVTTPHEDHVHGMTANAFTSVSLDPPLVLVSIDKRASMHALLPATGVFGVSVLRADQEDISTHFAGRRSEAVDAALSYDVLDGVPVLADCVSRLACRLWATYDGGDHTLYVGEVLSLSLHEGDPLLYYRSKYRQIQPS